MKVTQLSENSKSSLSSARQSQIHSAVHHWRRLSRVVSLLSLITAFTPKYWVWSIFSSENTPLNQKTQAMFICTQDSGADK